MAELGRGAQVLLDGDARKAARGVAATTLRGNADAKIALEIAGAIGDGTTPDGSSRTGAPPEDVLLSASGAVVGLGAEVVTPRIAQVGDSRTAQGWSGTQQSPHGYQYWASLALGGRVTFPQDLNFAVSGYTSTQARDAIGAVLLSDCDAVVLLVGTNDRAAGVAAATTIENIEAIISGCQTAGKTIFVIADLPRGDTTFTNRRLPTNDLLQHFQVIRWTLQQTRRAGVYPIDPWPTMAVAGSTTGDAILGMFYDGLHESQVGAKAIGDALAAVMERVYPPIGQDILSSNADLFEATYNPRGNLVANGMMDGTAGALASGVTGQIADGWTLATMPAGVSCVASKVTGSDGEVWQQMVFSGTPSAGGVFEFRRDVSPLSNIGASDRVYATGAFEVEAGSSGYWSPYIGPRLLFAGSATQAPTFGVATALSPPPSVAYGGYGRSGATTAAGEVPTLARVRISGNFITGVPVVLTLRVRALALRKLI